MAGGSERRNAELIAALVNSIDDDDKRSEVMSLYRSDMSFHVALDTLAAWLPAWVDAMAYRAGKAAALREIAIAAAEKTKLSPNAVLGLLDEMNGEQVSGTPPRPLPPQVPHRQEPRRWWHPLVAVAVVVGAFVAFRWAWLAVFT